MLLKHTLGLCLSAWATDIATPESNKDSAPSSYDLGVICVIFASRSKVLSEGESDSNIFFKNALLLTLSVFGMYVLMDRQKKKL